MKIFLSILSMFLAATALYYLSRDLLPPQTLNMAAGTKGGGYWQISTGYKGILARDGIDVTLVETAGSVESAALLASGEVQAAIIQGGVPVEGAMETLGSVFFEPIFVFKRKGTYVPTNIGEWPALEIAAGSEGSGTRAVVDTLIKSAKLKDITILPLSGAKSAHALLQGEMDMAIFVAPIDAPYLKPLFKSPEIDLLILDYIDALATGLPQSAKVEIPAGAVSLSPTIPQNNVELLAMVAKIVTPADLHPSLVDRLVEAERELHAGRNQITPEGRFPAITNVAMPIDPYAKDLITNGPSAFRGHLPYWVLAQISRFAILLLPILFILVPLLRAIPSLYRWRMRSRVYRHYATIREIDETARSVSDPEQLRELAVRLNNIDGAIAALKLPPAFRENAYTARLHVDLLLKRISDRLK